MWRAPPTPGAHLQCPEPRRETRGDIEITLILLHIFVATDAVYQALTIFGKDCGNIG
jgi:hypothetical protein